jgi:hypothetical protein
MKYVRESDTSMKLKYMQFDIIKRFTGLVPLSKVVSVVTQLNQVETPLLKSCALSSKDLC